MSCGIGLRCGLDPTLLWLSGRQAAAAWIQPLAWEPPYDTGAALKRKKKRKRKPYMYCTLSYFNIKITSRLTEFFKFLFMRKETID